MSAVLFLHAAATWAMVGLIWFVQIVHYPLFATVARLAQNAPEDEDFSLYAERHQQLTTLVVAPLMLGEAFSSVALFYVLDDGPVDPLLWTGVGLLFAIWLSTAIIQVPLHGQLAHAYEAHAQRRLVRSNWLRTFAWSARGVIALLLMR